MVKRTKVCPSLEDPQPLNLELLVLKSFFDYNVFTKYFNFLGLTSLKENNKELSQLFQCVEAWHTKYNGNPSLTSVLDLQVFHGLSYPGQSTKVMEVIQGLLDRLETVQVNPDLTTSYLDGLREHQLAHRNALLWMETAEGHRTFKDSVLESQTLLEGVTQTEAELDPFVSSKIEDGMKVMAQGTGLKWPLRALNQMFGPLRKGDYGFIFARPETGKTTFVAHVATHMATQTDLPVIWFNNEQEGHVVQSYCHRAALGLTIHQLHSNLRENEQKYEATVGQRIRIYDSASIHKTEVENLLRRFGAGLIIFDQIDKIKGFNIDRNDLELGAIYQWARELAKRFAPVIGVCQAGQSGANKRYLEMTDVVDSKTSKQAEADWILGIGKLDQIGYESVRHFHACKNKLIGDAHTLPELRHGKIDVLIRQETARFEDTHD